MPSIVYFVLDNIMYWEAFRWERYNLGHIYLQLFPNNKMYVGQTVNYDIRVYSYKNNKGSNKHHTNAIKHHGWKNVKMVRTVCPWYLLDTVEMFLIEYFDSTDPSRGYNKTTGGRKFWKFSNAQRAYLSQAQKLSFVKDPERAQRHSANMQGTNNPCYGKFGAEHPAYGLVHQRTPEQNEKLSGEYHWTKRIIDAHPCAGDNHWTKKLKPGEHPRFGKKQTPEEIEKKSGDNHWTKKINPSDNPNIGKKKTPEQLEKITGNNHWAKKLKPGEYPNTGRKWTEEQKTSVSGSNHHNFGKSGVLHHNSKPICVLGKVYPAVMEAGRALHDEYAPNNKGKKGVFILKWPKSPKHKHYTFYISKEFYEYALEHNLSNITCEQYEDWLKTM